MACNILSACDPYKVSPFDNQSLVNACMVDAECRIDDMDDNYDIEDEDVYYQYLVEECIDDHYDELRERKEEGCGREYKAYRKCMWKNAPDLCDQQDDYVEYYEDLEETRNETCLAVYAPYYECYIGSSIGGF